MKIRPVGTEFFMRTDRQTWQGNNRVSKFCERA